MVDLQDGPSEGLICPVAPLGFGGTLMDTQLAYDTLLVAWVLGLALFLFSLGRLVGASGWPSRR